MANLTFSCSAAAEEPSSDYTDDLVVTIENPVIAGINAAPSPVFFRVANVTGCTAADPVAPAVRDPKFHEITYVWDFGDATNATPSTSAILAMPTAWKDINKGYGREAAHVYNDPSPPGGYTVTVTAYEPTTRRKGSATVQVTINDPNTVFPTTQTIVYDPDNIVTLSSYGIPNATRVTTNWNAVIQAKENLGDATIARILIAPDVVEVVGSTRLYNDNNWANIRIGALDPNGTKPIIRKDNTSATSPIRCFNETNMQEIVLYGLRLEGPWDSPTETGPAVRPIQTFNINRVGFLGMAHRCELDGWDVLTFTGSSTVNADFYQCVSETHITNWLDYAQHGTTNAKNATIACKLTQNVDALSGGRDSRYFHNEHGCYRGFFDKHTYISVCDMLSRNGWSGGSTGLDGLSATADQACIRLNTNATANSSANVERCVLEGQVWMEPGAGDSASGIPGNYVFDKIIQLCGSKMGPRPHGFRIRYGGTTCRNVLQHVINVPAAQTSYLSEGFYLRNTNNPATNQEAIHIYNCTLVDHRTNANANSITLQHVKNESAAPFSTVMIRNNVMHQPNRSPAVVPDAPLDLSTAIGNVVGRHKGPRYNFLHETITLASDVGPGQTVTIPYSSLKTTRTQFSTETDNGDPTDQTYWETHLGTRHKVRVGTGLTSSSTIYHNTFPNNFSIAAPGVSGITVTNTSTATTWPAGQFFQLQLERTTALPAFDDTLSSVGFTATTARPTSGSAAITSATPDHMAYDDLLLAVKPIVGTRGVLEPA